MLPLSIWLHQNTCGRAFEPRKAQDPKRVLGLLPATPSPRIGFS
jgi:hypothetical protein